MSRSRLTQALPLVLATLGRAGTCLGGGSEWAPIGPPGASVSAVVLDPGSSTVYLATDGGSIFRSADAGASWKKIYSSKNDVGDLLASGSSLFAALKIPGETGGVVRSRDGGQSWSAVGLSTESLTSLAADPADPARIFAVSSRSLYRSTDAGDTWTALIRSDDGSFLQNVAIDPANVANLFVGTLKGGYRSQDGGTSFFPVNRTVDCANKPATCDYAYTNLPAGPAGPFLFDPGSPGTVYARTPIGQYRSRDGGTTWALYGPAFSAVALDPARPGRAYGISENGIFVGVEPGVWTPAGGAAPWDFRRASVLTADRDSPARLYAGTGWGAYRTDDGGKSWLPISAGLHEITVSAFAFDPSDVLTWYAAVPNRGIFKTVDGGLRWDPTGYVNPATRIEQISVDPFGSGVVLAVRSDDNESGEPGGKRVERSSDGGRTWSRGGEIPNYPRTFAGSPRGFLADPTLPGSWYLAKAGCLAITRDGGLTWYPAGPSTHGDSLLPPFFFSLAVDRRIPGVFYAAGVGPILRTTDHGASWIPIPNSDINTAGIEVDPRNSTVYELYIQLLAVGGGAVWDPKDYPPSVIAETVSADAFSGTLYLTARILKSTSRLFQSRDSGQTWQSEDLPDTPISPVIAHPRDGRLAIVTASGVYGKQICGDSTTLCFGGGRFLAKAKWRTPDGLTGDGRAVPLSSDSGYFWFFSPESVEIVTKIVDGCGVNQRTWVFAAGMTNVEVLLTVTDTRTGTVRTFSNTQGRAFRPVQDTDAFPGCAPLPAAAATAVAPASGPATLERAGSSCGGDATTLCLENGRFQLRLRWTDSFGNTGTGQAVKLTEDTGYFWFFTSRSAEVFAKAVDGCVVNSHHWFFAAGLTDVEVVLTATDTATGAARTYFNPRGTAFAPIQDAAAFPGCP